MSAALVAGKSLQDWLSRADALCGDGRFFDAHEELEIPWKAAEGETKILLQGLIQIAAGLHRLRLDPKKIDGALYLLDRGAEKMRRTSSLLAPESLAAFESEFDRIRKAGVAPEKIRFGLRVEID